MSQPRHYVQAEYDGTITKPEERECLFLICHTEGCGRATIRKESYGSKEEWQNAQRDFMKEHHCHGVYKQPPTQRFVIPAKAAALSS